MDSNNNITPNYEQVRNQSNFAINHVSEPNDLCEDCQMRNQNVKAEFTCTECKVNICINCSVRQHKQHADKFHNIYEYVEKHEADYFNGYSTNFQLLGSDIQELFEKECNPLEQAVNFHQQESKRRKEVLELLQNKIRSLVEEEEYFSNDVLTYLMQEKKSLKQKQKKLFEAVRNGIRYIEFLTEKVLKTKSIQERALDINKDFLKDELEKIHKEYIEEYEKSKNNVYGNKINNFIKNTTEVVNFEEKVKTLEQEITQMYNNYRLAVANFRKEVKIPELSMRSFASDSQIGFESRRSIIGNLNSNANLNLNYNAQRGLTPRDDVPMNYSNSNSKEQIKNEFSIFDGQINNESANMDKTAKNPIYPSFNDSSKNYNFNLNQQNAPITTSSKNLIYHNQGINTPNSNLNAPKAAASLKDFNLSVADSNRNFQASAVDSKQNDSFDSKIPKQIPSRNLIPEDKQKQKSSENIPLIPTSNQNQSISNKMTKELNENAYFIGIKSKPNNEVVTYNKFTNIIKTLKIDESCYLHDEKNSYKQALFPYENSKYVNVGGNSALVTGGNFQKASTDHCFKITIIAPSDDNQTEKLTISKYPNMISKRERHNIVHLPDINQVVVCSGFYVKGCEYTDLNSIDSKKWRKLPDLSESRGNATIFYLNNRFIYILGGFKVNESTGEYLNSLEYMDFLKKDKWNLIKMENLTAHSIRISAMGVIGLDKDRVLLVGGYDGSSYLKSGFNVEFEDGVIKSFEKKENLLSRGSIFFSNPMFMKLNDNLCFNFELQAKAILYDYYKTEFQFVVQSQIQAGNN